MEKFLDMKRLDPQGPQNLRGSTLKRWLQLGLKELCKGLPGVMKAQRQAFDPIPVEEEHSEGWCAQKKLSGVKFLAKPLVS